MSFQGLESNEAYVWLINAYNPGVITRIMMPPEINYIVATFISENNDLFIGGETDKEYIIYMIDLDRLNLNTIRVKELLRYNK